MNHITADIEAKEKTAQFLWTGFILLFFVIQAILWTIAITFTSGDTSHAVVAGYEEKAMKWDEQVAERAASSRLGWTVNLVVEPGGDVRSCHNFALQIQDRQGQPVSGATIQLNAFHRGAAGAPQSITLNETNNGTYAGTVTIRKSGYWQFNGQAIKNDSLFLIQERQFLKVSK